MPVRHTETMLEGRIRANMRALRELGGLSRPQLAKLCSPPVSYQQIEKLENGERRLTVEWVERVADALRVDPELLVSGKPQFNLASPVALEAARTISTVALQGVEPDRLVVEQVALLLKALIETFVRHPEARGDLGAARPVIDLLARQFSRR